MTRMPILVALAGALAGCHNACQDVCLDMAQYAEDECGFTVLDAEVDECIDVQAEATSEARAACREFGNERSIDDEWGCEELAGYFDE